MITPDSKFPKDTNINQVSLIEKIKKLMIHMATYPTIIYHQLPEKQMIVINIIKRFLWMRMENLKV